MISGEAQLTTTVKPAHPRILAREIGAGVNRNVKFLTEVNIAREPPYRNDAPHGDSVSWLLLMSTDRY